MGDRANTDEIRGSLRFFGKRIQRTFPRSKCRVNDGDHQLFLYENIQYLSEMALMMADCDTFLDQTELVRIVKKHNVLMQFQKENAIKDPLSILLFTEDKGSGDGDADRNGNGNRVDIENGKRLRNGHSAVDRRKYKKLNVKEEFNRLNDAMSVTIGEMNRKCSVLQDLFTLKLKLRKQLIRLVKYHW